MNRKDITGWPSGLTKALHQMLLKRIPPNDNSPYLEDIVNALVEEMARGEFSLSMNKTPPPVGLKEDGWPELHSKALLESGWLDGEQAPIVLEGDQISWRRWHIETSEIVSSLLLRSRTKPKLSLGRVRDDSIPRVGDVNEEQKAAIDAITKESVLLLSGGPGTGKTTTIAKMLERAISFDPDLKISLAAPTGKAARRMQDALQAGNSGSLETFQGVEIKRLSCVTLHKLLLAGPGGFGRNKQNPLNVDLLVVDEMSMVDTDLLRALLEALPDDCQLVLVGDPNQLPPVGSCAIWHKLQENDVRKQFGQGAICLHRLYRNRGSLASLSNVLRDQGLQAFWERLLSQPRTENVVLHQYPLNKNPKVLFTLLRPHLQELETLCLRTLEKVPEDFYLSSVLTSENEVLFELLFQRIDQLMVLCPKRRGVWGVDYVHKHLLGKSFEEGENSWPQGTPVICGENQPEIDLANGDIGLVLGEGARRRLLFRVISSEGDASLRLIHPVRILRLDPAMALTVHKAQGSEANQVVILWPDHSYAISKDSSLGESSDNNDGRMMYTALTRARNRVDLITSSI